MKKLICLVTLIMTFPIVLAAQNASSGSASGAPTATFGSSVPTPLEFQGQSMPTNVVTLSTGVSMLYDDNVLSRNDERLTDEALSFNAQLGISRKTEHATISLDYLPFFMLYHQFTDFDRLNHAANLAMTFPLGEHFIMRLHDVFSYQNGVYPAITGQSLQAGPPSPTALNPLIYSPTTRTLSNTPGLDLTFIASSRTSITLSGSYDQRKFAAQAGAGQPLYNDTSINGSFDYQYRVTNHTSFGFLLLHQDSTYQGGEIFGSRQRTQVESAVVSLSSRLAPTVTVNIYGGPQYIHTLGQSTVGTNIPGEFEGSGGGSITKEVRRTALVLSAQRAVSDGGGLYTSVIDTSVTFGVRRRLVGRWEANWSAGAAQADTSLFQLSGKTDSLTGGVDFIRPLGSGGTAFRISYDTTHQLTKGSLPVIANFDRNQVTVGIDYQLKAIPVGR